MLITKFNKLIRNRLVWAAVAVLVSVSFVLSASSVRGCKTDERQSGMGEIFGRNVPREEFLRARFFEIGMRDSETLPPDAEEMLRRRTWQRIALLETARKMGLNASDTEVAEAIQRDPTFADNGVFNREKYRAIVERQLRIPVETFEEYVRQDLALRKLNAVSESLLWIAPSDLNRRLANLTDRMKVEYGLLPADRIVTNEVEVSEEVAFAFYDTHTNIFLVPEKVSVRYVSFPVSNYLASVEIDESDIEAYYDDHLEEYMTVDTNGTSTPVPIEEVRAGIESNLVIQSATFKAKDKATELVMELAPDREGNAKEMSIAATEAGLSVRTTGYFSVYEDVPQLNVGAAFKEAAFRLDPRDPNGYFSDAVVDDGAVYVVATSDRKEAHLPAFSNIVEKVMPLAVSNALNEALIERAAAIRDEVIEAGTNTTFSMVMAEYGAAVTTSSVFSVYEGMSSNDQEYAELLIPALVSLGAGDISQPVKAEGGALLARLIERKPGEMELVEYLRPQLLQTLNRYWSGALFSGWGDYVLDTAGFRDYTAAVEDDEDETEDVPPADEEI